MKIAGDRTPVPWGFERIPEDAFSTPNTSGMIGWSYDCKKILICIDGRCRIGPAGRLLRDSFYIDLVPDEGTVELRMTKHTKEYEAFVCKAIGGVIGWLVDEGYLRPERMKAQQEAGHAGR